MPVWHEQTKSLQAQGRFQMVGIIQEQHPDRARLFMQWKQMGWPILVDSLDLLNTMVVPQTVLIDEAGVVQKINARLNDLKPFLDRPAVSVDPKSKVTAAPHLEKLKKKAKSGDPQAVADYASALVLWGDVDDLDAAVDGYERALDAGAEVGATNFRLGVAYRKRYDSADRKLSDFASAIDHWAKALDADPNQYIWRRRIQQYGPRLDKPYPFYDWVEQARKDILDRGETPSPLKVEPQGAEIASPESQFASVGETRVETDPAGRILRDTDGLIEAEAVIAPSTDASQPVVRVHLLLHPNGALKAHWNNEADDLEIWLTPPAGWQTNGRLRTAPSPRSAVSDEDRSVEFELRHPADAPPGDYIASAYALYYVCEDVDGVCRYLRQDIPIHVRVK